MSHDEPMPAAEPLVGDELVDRLIRNAVVRGEHRRQRRMHTALAASLLCAGVTLAALQVPDIVADRRAPVVLVRSDAVHPLRLIYDSKVERADAQVSVTLGRHLAFAGQPGLRVAAWSAPLEKGKNLLELPVLLSGADEERLEVVFSSNEGLKRIRVVVRAAKPTLNEAEVSRMDFARSVT